MTSDVTFDKVRSVLGLPVEMPEREKRFCASVLSFVSSEYRYSISREDVSDVCSTLGINMNRLKILTSDVIVSVDSMPENYIVDSFVGAVLTYEPEHNRQNINSIELAEFLSRLSVLMQHKYFKKGRYLEKHVTKSLTLWKLPYYICDGVILPSGVEELDKAVICDVASWLKKYKKSHKFYMEALQKRSNGAKPEDIVDTARKALESFLSEFFQSDKNFDSSFLRVRAGQFFKERGVPKQLSNIIGMLGAEYVSYNNDYIKHPGATCKSSVEYPTYSTTMCDAEFMLYLTGIIIRYIIETK